MIISFATAAPFFADPSLDAGPDSLWNRTTRTKKNIVPVCKKWRDIGSEFLYRDIVLRRCPNATSLSWTLKSDSGTSHGRHIRTLHCSYRIPDFDILDGSDFTSDDALRHILLLAPRIEDFSIQSPYGPYPSSDPLFMQDWCSAFSRLTECIGILESVRHLRVAVATPATFGIDLHDLRNFPNLNSLTLQTPNLAVLYHDLIRQFTEGETITLPELQHLRCSTLDSISIHFLPFVTISLFDMPRLSMLTMSLEFIQTPVDIYHRPLMETIETLGPQLTYLHFHNVNYARAAASAGFDIQTILDLCPILEHLVIPLSTINAPLSHPVLRWLDIWALSNRDLADALATEIVVVGADRTVDWDMARSFFHRHTHPGCPRLVSVRHLDRLLSSRYVDLPLQLSPRNSIFPPSDDHWDPPRMTFELSNSVVVVQTPEGISREEAGYIFSGSDSEDDDDFGESEDEDEGLQAESGTESMSRSEDSLESSESGTVSSSS